MKGEPSIVSEVSSAVPAPTFDSTIDYDARLKGSTVFGVRGGLGQYAFGADVNRTAPSVHATDAELASKTDLVTPVKVVADDAHVTSHDAHQSAS